jgi:hypothetical protein
MVHLGVVSAPYTQNELMHRILYHCKDLNKVIPHQPSSQVVHKVEEDHKEPEKTTVTLLLA